jgi:hypothetical protein
METPPKFRDSAPWSVHFAAADQPLSRFCETPLQLHKNRRRRVDFLFVIATKAYAPALIILANQLSRMELA